MTTFVVSISGGKDSTACAALAIERYGAERVRMVFADTGHEHPQTYDYVHGYLPQALGLPVATVRADFSRQIARKREYVAEKWPEKGVPDSIISDALGVLSSTGNPYLDLCLWKGRFPSRRAQFCTHELKVNPIGEYILGVLDRGATVESWQGVRRDESASRRYVKDREPAGDRLTIVRPIADWTAQQTVDYVRSRGVRLNPLYSQGMNRVGCMPCINASKGELAAIAARWPEEVARVAEWERLVCLASKMGASSFFHAGEGTPLEGCHSILQTVEWARTSRGGRQWRLDIAETAACESAYGLCE